MFVLSLSDGSLTWAERRGLFAVLLNDATSVLEQVDWPDIDLAHANFWICFGVFFFGSKNLVYFWRVLFAINFIL